MKLSNLALAAVVAAFALPTLSSTASAYECTGARYASDGIGQTHMQGRAIARNAWTNKVKSSAGYAWSVWQIAKDKSINCQKISSNAWRCRALAKPCKYAPKS